MMSMCIWKMLAAEPGFQSVAPYPSVLTLSFRDAGDIIFLGSGFEPSLQRLAVSDRTVPYRINPADDRIGTICDDNAQWDNELGQSY